MKRILLLLFLLFVLGITGLFIFIQVKNRVRFDLAQSIDLPKNTPTPTIDTSNLKITTSIFVPYWTVTGRNIVDRDFDQYIYFGILPNGNGITNNETGAIRLRDFVRSVPPGKTTLLTLRMVDAQDDFAILKDANLQKKIIDQTIILTKENKFDGIVVDLELSAIPFDSLIRQINGFTATFYSSAKKNHLTFYLTLYGDTFYRLRPFDVKTIAGNTDGIMLMAYDFHKAKANPGPNFPLYGRETYGYDFAEMIDDFTQVVQPSKLTVIFGMFGYDWKVDSKGQALEEAEPLPYTEIQKKFLVKCLYNDCATTRDDTSSESIVHYVDGLGQRHIIWFEDPDSVSAKIKYLRGRGIGNFSYWAHSYF